MIKVLCREYPLKQNFCELIASSLQKMSVAMECVSIQAKEMYFIEHTGLTHNENLLLEHVLSAQDIQKDGMLYESHTEKHVLFFMIAPRVGIISPWSSKATNIFHNLECQHVTRIERGFAYWITFSQSIDREDFFQQTSSLYDPMVEKIFFSLEEIKSLFLQHAPRPLDLISVLQDGAKALQKFNHKMGLSLSKEEIEYITDYFIQLNRDPTDVEIMMFAQVNSEHCRHKIFNAQWIIDGEQQPLSLFDMIKKTYTSTTEDILSAYKDNAAVIKGARTHLFFPDPVTQKYDYHELDLGILMKVETHNHPTAISPYHGAATGAGGEIRDEGATGRGAKTKAGLSGFSVSNLRIPGFIQPWEKKEYGYPHNIANALTIMLEGPIGNARFNNEFGRPGLHGYFRTYEQAWKNSQGEPEIRGYHKPISLAGGFGNIHVDQVQKEAFSAETKLIVLGGPAMNIGLGGGASSSSCVGSHDEELDFSSVQRDNAEMERRCQEVIDRCWQQGKDNPILFIHDVGAGGLSNALPELVYDNKCGGWIDLRAVLNDEPSMSPLELWCNEAQERYVLAIATDKIDCFHHICQREGCPYAIVGHAMSDQYLTVSDSHFKNKPIHLPLAFFFDHPPSMVRQVKTYQPVIDPFDTTGIDLNEAIDHVLRLPAVANKDFLITIGDRSITGCVVREQMVGPWQVAVSDCAITCHGYQGYQGEAMTIGERAPIALLNAPASGKMAVGEAITNIAAAPIQSLSHVKLSANWMAAAEHGQEDVQLFETVKAVGMDLCRELGVTIPVGKDSLSMQTVWENKGSHHQVIAPLSLIISAFAPVYDVRKNVTPQLSQEPETSLFLIDLGQGKNRLGGSALSQVYQKNQGDPPDVDSAENVKNFFHAIQQLIFEEKILAYHDRSDGGLLVTLFEMAFAGHIGIHIQLDDLMQSSTESALGILFSEELGAVVQIYDRYIQDVQKIFSHYQLDAMVHKIGTIADSQMMTCTWKEHILFVNERRYYQRVWSEMSYHMRKIRDNKECAQQEFDQVFNDSQVELHFKIPFDDQKELSAPHIMKNKRPQVAILREQGVNGHIEMAAAFDAAGFAATDIHMNDLITNKKSLDVYQGIVFCGGFSYGDVLGAGLGWASTILYHESIQTMFRDFFQRSSTFTLGVCNGCQMLSYLKNLLMGASHWPSFKENTSRQFEARTVMVKIQKSPSLFFHNMEEAELPVAVAHGEGRVVFNDTQDLEICKESNHIVMSYIGKQGTPTEIYPDNPNGSIEGIAGLTSKDGRATIIMPHPERMFRNIQHTWLESKKIKHDRSPWFRMFRNAYLWVDS